MTTTPIPAPDAEAKAGLLSLDELRALATARPPEMVLLAVPDGQGRLQGKRMPASHFLDHVADAGADFCGYLLATDTAMRPLDGYAHASWATGYGDMLAVPDPAAIRRLAWPGAGTLVFADAHNSAGEPVRIAPRSMLRRELDLLQADFGLTVKAGLEAEFSLYHGNARAARTHLQPVSTDNLDYHLTQPYGIRAFLQELEEALIGSGLPLEATKSEAGPGQVEITFRYGDPLAAADQHLVLKHAAREIGDVTAITPTFMAAPETGTGNGLHIHLSLWNNEQPAIASDDGGLLPTGLHAVAGLTEVLPQLMPLMLPTVNSYKRLRPHSFAPTHMAWGWDNRTCAVRVTGHRSHGCHLEIRVPGADANPYLALTAVIAAIRHGLKHTLNPPQPVTDNAYQADDLPRLPRTLDAATYTFAASKTAAELLGPDVVTHYTTAARHEIAAMTSEVTDIERTRGFHV